MLRCNALNIADILVDWRDERCITAMVVAAHTYVGWIYTSRWFVFDSNFVGVVVVNSHVLADCFL